MGYRYKRIAESQQCLFKLPLTLLKEKRKVVVGAKSTHQQKIPRARAWASFAILKGYSKSSHRSAAGDPALAMAVQRA